MVRRKKNELGTDNKITVFWVPGHIGVEGNKSFDKFADNQLHWTGAILRSIYKRD